MTRTGILCVGAFAAFGACSPIAKLTQPEPLPDFTAQEKADIVLTVQFFKCTEVNVERINAVHPNDKEYVMEFCANSTGFTLDTFSNLTNEMTMKYGENWPDMLETMPNDTMPNDFSWNDYEPPLIPDFQEDISF